MVKKFKILRFDLATEEGIAYIEKEVEQLLNHGWEVVGSGACESASISQIGFIAMQGEDILDRLSFKTEVNSYVEIQPIIPLDTGLETPLDATDVRRIKNER